MKVNIPKFNLTVGKLYKIWDYRLKSWWPCYFNYECEERGNLRFITRSGDQWIQLSVNREMFVIKNRWVISVKFNQPCDFKIRRYESTKSNKTY